MLRGIRGRIAVPYLILILLVMGVLITGLMRSVRAASLLSMQHELASHARLVADAMGEESGAEAERLAAHYGELLRARVTIIRVDGEVSGESQQDAELLTNHLLRPEIQAARSTGEGRAIRYSETVRHDMMYVAVPIKTGALAGGWVRVALPLRELDARLAMLRHGLLLGMGVVSLAATAIALWIAGRITQPIRWLTQDVQRMTQGDMSIRLVPSTQDEVGVLVGAFNDLARRVQAIVGELAAESTQLATVLEHMPDGVIITDRKGRVRLVNPAAAREFGTSVDEAQNRSFAQVVRHHELVDVWRQCCETQQETHRMVQLDGRRQALQLIATPLRTGGEQCCLVLVQDLTHVRRLETVRRDFVSNVSHELRTPLASQKALVESLRTAMIEDPEAAQRFLLRMEIEVDAMTQMVQELLELSRIESGKVPLVKRASTLRELVEPPAERLQPQAERAGLMLTLDLPTEAVPVVADVERMHQVITNIVHNAIKFTPAGGTVTVSAQQVENEAVIRVSDTGIGIADEDLPRIFERFFKTDRARASAGTGLGLSIARHIVEGHGGHIWAESREGVGSTFCVAIPLDGGGG